MRPALHRYALAALIAGLIVLAPQTATAVVNLPWSTTYNCPDWKQSDGLYPPAINCDGLTGYGAWTTTDGREEQIGAAANYPSGAGGKGQRHWLGDPAANNSGGTKIEWISPQPEIWIRWYMRFQNGFEWNPQLGEYKILYVDVGTARHVIIGFRPNNDRLGIVVNGNPFDSPDGSGWNTIMANGGTDARGNKTSDGLWHLYEIHMKMDTNGADGIVEWWVDGARRLYRTDVNFRTHSGWSYMAIGENHAWSGNGPAAFYVDYDDIAIRTTGPIGPVGPADTLAPAAPSNLTVQ